MTLWKAGGNGEERKEEENETPSLERGGKGSGVALGEEAGIHKSLCSEARPSLGSPHRPQPGSGSTTRLLDNLEHQLTPARPTFASSVKCRLCSDFSLILQGENQTLNRASSVWHGLVPSSSSDPSRTIHP